MQHCTLTFQCRILSGLQLFALSDEVANSDLLPLFSIALSFATNLISLLIIHYVTAKASATLMTAATIFGSLTALHTNVFIFCSIFDLRSAAGHYSLLRCAAHNAELPNLLSKGTGFLTVRYRRLNHFFHAASVRLLPIFSHQFLAL
jgi:hypothetical protein